MKLERADIGHVQVVEVCRVLSIEAIEGLRTAKVSKPHEDTLGQARAQYLSAYVARQR